MKKIMIFLVGFFIILGLVGCNELTYEELYQQYQNDIDIRQETYDDYIDLYEELSLSQVQSVVKITNTINYLQGASIGSGFVFFEDETYYYALTNAHVVYNEGYDNTLEISDYNGNTYVGELIASDESYDLAIIAFEKATEILKVATFTDEPIYKRDTLYVIGFPNGQINGITIGEFIDFDQVEIDSNAGSNIIFDVLVLDAPVEAGSSGSIILNDLFEVVGIIYAGNFINDDETSTFAFGVPKDRIFEFFDDHEFPYESGDAS